MTTGNISKVETLGLVDGPGVRVVVFISGCSLRCKYCHNPEMWNINSGNTYTPDEILNIIMKYKNYFNDNGGVTFSGGEPLLQGEFLLECLKLCKSNNINTVLDTSGCIDSKLNEEILKYVDLVIFDIKELDKEKYKWLTGKDIDNSLKFLKLVQDMGKDLWIRSVIVPTINDNEQYIESLYNFIRNIKNVKKVELLPYHTMALSKYEKLGISYPLKDIKDMSSNRCTQLETLLNNKLRGNYENTKESLADNETYNS